MSELPKRLEPWCRLVQDVLSEEFNEPTANFRKVSEKIVMKIFLRAGVVWPFSDNIGKVVEKNEL